MYIFSKHSKNNMINVDYRLKEIASKALSISYIDFGIPTDGGLRSIRTQRKLFEKGFSLCDGVIRKSKHQSGEAIDFFAYVDGKASWDKQYLTIIAAAFLEAAKELKYEVVWGGHWNYFKDYAHIQLK